MFVRLGLVGIVYISYMMVDVFVCCNDIMYHIVFNLHLFKSLLLVHLRQGLPIMILQLLVIRVLSFWSCALVELDRRASA